MAVPHHLFQLTETPRSDRNFICFKWQPVEGAIYQQLDGCYRAFRWIWTEWLSKNSFYLHPQYNQVCLHLKIDTSSSIDLREMKMLIRNDADVVTQVILEVKII